MLIGLLPILVVVGGWVGVVSFSLLLSNVFAGALIAAAKKGFYKREL